MNWHVIRTIPRHRIEFSVRHALNQREHPAMVPFEEKLVQNPRTKRLDARKFAFFPGYVMAAFESINEFAEAKRVINKGFENRGQIPPILNLIGPSGSPWVLSQANVEFLQTLSIEKPTEVNLHKAIAVGQDFMMLDGTYKGFVAKMQSVDRKRIKALMMMFGQMRLIEIPATTTVVAA